MDPLNSSTFHIPASKLHLVLEVSLMGAHQFGVGLTSNASPSSGTHSMGDDADMPPKLKDVSHGGAAQISGNSTMIS